LPDAGTQEGVARRRPALSPSRAGDFKQCPLLYRFRVVDRLPEAPSPVAVRGTVVHAVLERLFALPADERVPARAQELLEPAWRDLQAAEPELGLKIARRIAHRWNGELLISQDDRPGLKVELVLSAAA
jgi:putative RecB family exonuclease